MNSLFTTVRPPLPRPSGFIEDHASAMAASQSTGAGASSSPRRLSTAGAHRLSRPASVGVKTEVKGTAGPSIATAIGIALAATAGLALFFAIVYWHLRSRRRSSSRRALCDFTKTRGGLMATDSSMPLVSSTTSPASHDNILLTPPPRVRERKLRLTKASCRSINFTEERAWPGQPLSSLRSSAATATEMVSSCQKTPSARDEETCHPPAVATPATETSVKLDQETRGSSSISANGPNPTRAAAPDTVPAAGHDHIMAARPQTPCQYHLPFQASGSGRLGPPRGQVVPPTTRDAQCPPLASPILRRGHAGPTGEAMLANVSQAIGSPMKFTGATAPSRAPAKATSSPRLEEGELERLGGSYK